MEGANWGTCRGAEGAFGLAMRYTTLIAPPSRADVLREAAAHGGGFPYSERHLQCVWFDARWRPALTTLDGEPVTVLSPGRWNLEAGPDFLGAMLEVGPDRRRIAGDVEVHVHPSNWTQHGHGADPRYTSLAAHVTYFAGDAPLPGLPPGTVRIALRDALRASQAFSFDLVDVTAYPFSALPVDCAPCARLMSAWSREARETLLVAAAHERLRVKAARIAARVADAGAGQAFYEEVMTALGYKHNRAAFLTLARRAPVSDLARATAGDALKAYAALMGVAGWLPVDAPRGCDAETRGFVRALWDAWWKMPSPWHERARTPIEWRAAGLRPQNHPRRRLAAAAALFADAPALMDQIVALGTARSTWFGDAAAAFDRDRLMPYWPPRLALGGRATPRPTALVGPDRTAAIAANVLLPFLAAMGHDVAPLLDRLPPAGDNAVTRETAALLFGRDHNPALFHRGLLQQGLVQIFHDHCLNRRPGCDGCRLAQGLTDRRRGD